MNYFINPIGNNYSMFIYNNKPFKENYQKVIVTLYMLIFLFRLYETTLLFLNYGYKNEVLLSEFLGLCFDILGASIFILPHYFFSYLLYKSKFPLLKIINYFILSLASLLFFLIITFFIYQQIPLDIFLYKYSVQEIVFTVKTSDTNLYLVGFGLMIIFSLYPLISGSLSKISLSLWVQKYLFTFVWISLPSFLLLLYLGSFKVDTFSLNKPIYFISNSISYFSKDKASLTFNHKDFQELFPQKKFISNEYPLVYKIERHNELGPYFNTFKSKPNMVILIVEGLNDDFIHTYKGAMLMPFLNQLKDKSLYWKRCFTLGERSFAAVPSILGGLPYGNKGFTLQERLPRHLSLVSILNSNNYYTSFYYGQGAWFHQKDRFFKHNDIDLIFDNAKFSNDFEKIIVGNDHFFWGFNDKDLFTQSLRIIDTLKQKSRLDIYFTGTSHSPFKINNETYYNNRLLKLSSEPHQKFYQTYSKYLKTILFVDDALENFFLEYKKKPDYENTIFIITGDHPMTEIPIANSLKRYHVPLLIFSEKLKKNQTFSPVVSHLDISESLLAFLQEYLTQIPDISTSLGNQLNTQQNDSEKCLAFMNDNREVVDFLSGNHYLSNNNLFLVDSSLNITHVENDSIKTSLTRKLSAFNFISTHTAQNNKIISNDLYCKALGRLKIHEHSSIDSIKTASEYVNLTNNIPIPNLAFDFEISLNISPNKRSDIKIVYQITNSRDSVLLWNTFGVGDEDIIQAHIPIDKLPCEDSKLYFKTFLYNQKKEELTLWNIDILLHAYKGL